MQLACARCCRSLMRRKHHEEHQVYPVARRHAKDANNFLIEPMGRPEACGSSRYALMRFAAEHDAQKWQAIGSSTRGFVFCRTNLMILWWFVERTYCQRLRGFLFHRRVGILLHRMPTSCFAQQGIENRVVLLRKRDVQE